MPAIYPAPHATPRGRLGSTGLCRCRWNTVTYRVLVAAPAGSGTTNLCAGVRSARPEWQVLTASARSSAKAVCGALSLDAVVVDTGLGDDADLLLTDLAADHPRIGRVALATGRQADAHRVLLRNPPA